MLKQNLYTELSSSYQIQEADLNFNYSISILKEAVGQTL